MCALVLQPEQEGGRSVSGIGRWLACTHALWGRGGGKSKPYPLTRTLWDQNKVVVLFCFQSLSGFGDMNIVTCAGHVMMSEVLLYMCSMALEGATC